MYTICKYFLDKISELGIRHIFGVTSQFNIKFVNNIMHHKDISWCNMSSDYDASYAANGYSKINGISALLSSYGSNELKSIDAIANAYFEDVPIINIVCVPWTEWIMNNRNDNSIKNSIYGTFYKIYQNLTCYQVWLDNKNSIHQIDEAIKYAIFYKKPIYIMMPIEIMDIESPYISSSLNFSFPINNKGLNDFLNYFKNRLEQSEKTIMICGNLIHSYGTSELVEKISENLSINTVSIPCARGAINEQSKNYLGVYSGKNTFNKKILDFVNESDLIIKVGINTTGFNLQKNENCLDENRVIEIGGDYIKYQNKYISNVSMGAVLNIILKSNIQYNGYFIKNNLKEDIPFTFDNKTLISYDRFTQSINSILNEKDVIICDSNYAFYSSESLILKKYSRFLTNNIYNNQSNSFSLITGVKKANKSLRVINICDFECFKSSLTEIYNLFQKKSWSIHFILNSETDLDKNDNFNSFFIENVLKSFDVEKKKYEFFKINDEKELYECIILLKNLNNKLVFIEVNLNQGSIPKQLKKILEKNKSFY